MVTKSYVDEDGFNVTEDVWQDVEMTSEDEAEEQAALLAARRASPPRPARPVQASPGAGTPSTATMSKSSKIASQAKISAFFKKA